METKQSKLRRLITSAQQHQEEQQIYEQTNLEQMNQRAQKIQMTNSAHFTKDDQNTLDRYNSFSFSILKPEQNDEYNCEFTPKNKDDIDKQQQHQEFLKIDNKKVQTDKPPENQEQQSQLFSLGESVVSEYVSVDEDNRTSYQRVEQTHSQFIQFDEIVEVSELVEQKPMAKIILNIDEEKLLQSKSEMVILEHQREQEISKPIYFNVMIAGESGLGKSTFIDTFLNKKFEKLDAIRPTTVQIQEHRGKRSEGKINFNLTLIDTPGFTQSSDMKKWFQLIKGYIISKFEKYQSEESKLLENKNYFNGNNQLQDQRVHVCLYFMTGPRIKKIDLEILKRLQKLINIIPILAKGDTYTPEEIKSIKLDLQKDAAASKLEWFDCINCLKNFPKKQKKLSEGPFGSAPPFLIISSAKKIELAPNNYVFGRKYNWGLCNIENPQHSDFLLLYQLLIGHFSLELIHFTQYFFQRYLKKKLFQEKQQKNRKNKQIVKGAIFALCLSIGSLIFTRVKK